MLCFLISLYFSTHVNNRILRILSKNDRPWFAIIQLFTHLVKSEIRMSGLVDQLIVIYIYKIIY